MSTILLRPVGEGKEVVIPSGRTTIGRGPFLTVTDKRVSRSHAVLEVSHNTFTVTPIHVNPTFFKAQSNEKYVPLVKDEAKRLENGNIISLLPDKLAFQVVFEDVSDKKNEPLENGGCKQEVSRNNTSDVKLELSSSSRMATEAFDEDDAVHTTGETMDLSSSKTLEVTSADKTDERGDIDGKAKTPLKQPRVEPAAILDKTRVLPAWMRKESSGTPVTVKKSKQSKIVAEKKNQPECTKSATRGKKDKPEKTGIKSGRRKSSESDEDVVLDEENEEDEEEWEPREKKKTKMKSGKRNVSDSDEDFIVDEDEEDEWRPTSQKKSRGSGRGKTRGRGTTRSLGRGGGRGPVNTGSVLSRMMTPVKDKDFINDDDDDDEEESEEEEIKPKRKGKATPKKGKKTSPKKRISKGLSDSEEEYRPLSSAGSRKARNASDSEENKSKVKGSSRKRQISDSEEEEDQRPKRKPSDRAVIAGDESEESDNVGGKKSLPTCPYGKRCYRKNPAHFREYSHPDSDECQGGSGDGDSGEESDNDDRPECQYGTSCYRTNAKHRKEFKHTKDPDSSRPKRTTAGKKKGRKSVLDGEDDDDEEVNTYDYDDSFLVDESASSSASYGQDSDESDWRPDNDDDDDNEVEEDVRELVAEARGFLRSKRR